MAGGLLVAAALAAWQMGVFGPGGSRPLAQLRQRLGIGPAARPPVPSKSTPPAAPVAPPASANATGARDPAGAGRTCGARGPGACTSESPEHRARAWAERDPAGAATHRRPVGSGLGAAAFHPVGEPPGATHLGAGSVHTHGQDAPGGALRR